MTDAIPEASAAQARRKRLGRLVYGTYGLLVAAFVVHSTVQVVRTLFFGAEPGGKPLPAACASSLRGLVQAVDRAASSADRAPNEREARAAFTAALDPEWSGLEGARAACAADPDGEDALAATMRLERAHEAHAGDRAARTAELRRDVELRIDGPIRTPTRPDSR